MISIKQNVSNYQRKWSSSPASAISPNHFTKMQHEKREESKDKVYKGVGEAEKGKRWENRLKQMWNWWKLKQGSWMKHLWLDSLMNERNGAKLNMSQTVCNVCNVWRCMTQSTIGSLKPISQRPVPLPRLKGDVKGLWPLPFMCIDPSGGGRVSSSKPSNISCYILVSPAGSGTVILFASINVSLFHYNAFYFYF